MATIPVPFNAFQKSDFETFFALLSLLNSKEATDFFEATAQDTFDIDFYQLPIAEAKSLLNTLNMAKIIVDNLSENSNLHGLLPTTVIKALSNVHYRLMPFEPVILAIANGGATEGEIEHRILQCSLAYRRKQRHAIQ